VRAGIDSSGFVFWRGRELDSIKSKHALHRRVHDLSEDRFRYFRITLWTLSDINTPGDVLFHRGDREMN
jgi:hypothetical protein